MVDGVRVRSRGRLVHWDKEVAVQFVTFRLADSAPASLVRENQAQRRAILERARDLGRELTPWEEEKLAGLQRAMERHLDRGQGACVLRQPQAAKVVSDTLGHFDGQRYRLIAWCVMPNHVHVVASLGREYDLARILHSWKSFTAKEINRIFGHRGRLWQRESYDRLVRNEVELRRVVRYVVRNPEQCGLRDWPWVWSAEDGSGRLFEPDVESSGDGESASGGQAGRLRPLRGGPV